MTFVLESATGVEVKNLKKPANKLAKEPLPEKVAEEAVVETKEEKDKGFLPKLEISAADLPSKGLAYPVDLEIMYKPLSFGEIKRISQSQYKSDFKASFDVVLGGLVLSSDFNKYDITLADALYIGFLRKISTFGTNDLTLQYHCVDCDKKGEHRFKSDQLEFVDIKASKLPVTAELTSGKFRFSPVTVGQFLFLIKKKKEDDELAKFAVECLDLKFDQAYSMIESLVDPEDAHLLEIVEEHLEHGLKPVEFKCSNEIYGDTCNNEIKVYVEGGHTIIKPFRKSAKG